MGKIQDSHVSNARIAQWTLALINRGVEYKKEQAKPPARYGPVVQGKEHECPLPVLQHNWWPVTWGTSLAEAQMQGFVCWFCDGSSFHVNGSAKTGYAAIRVGDSEVLKGPTRPHSSQAAEVEALKAILEFEALDAPLVVFTDSDWTAKAFSVWLPVWIKQGWNNCEGKPVVHKQEWLPIVGIG